VTPLLLSSLGVEGYALWVTYYSIVGWGVLLDFGIGSVLINQLNKNDFNKSSYVLASLILYTLIFFSVSLVLICFFLDQSALFVFLLFIALSPLLSVPEKVFISSAKSYFVDFIQLVVTIIFLGSFFLLAQQDVFSLIVCFVVTSIIVRLFPLFYLLRGGFEINYKELFVIAKKLMFLGKDFFFLQIGAVLILSLERVVIFNYYSADDTAMYDVVSKCFMLILVFNNIFSRGVWGALANKEQNEGNLELFSWLIKISCYSFALFFSFSLVVPFFIDKWVGITVSLSLSLILAFWSYLHSLFVLACNLMNGLELHRTQTVFFIVGVFFKALLIYILTLNIITLNAYIFFSSIILLPYILYVFRFMRA